MSLVMYGYECEECHRLGAMVELTIKPIHRIRVEGDWHEIANARIGVCSKCKARSVDQIEQHRWYDILGLSFGDDNAFNYMDEMTSRFTLGGLPPRLLRGIRNGGMPW